MYLLYLHARTNFSRVLTVDMMVTRPCSAITGKSRGCNVHQYKGGQHRCLHKQREKTYLLQRAYCEPTLGIQGELRENVRHAENGDPQASTVAEAWQNSIVKKSIQDKANSRERVRNCENIILFKSSLSWLVVRLPSHNPPQTVCFPSSVIFIL